MRAGGGAVVGKVNVCAACKGAGPFRAEGSRCLGLRGAGGVVAMKDGVISVGKL